jgi:uncharacterized protein (UPF0332 family)/predicted nucleotidyltransferase
MAKQKKDEKKDDYSEELTPQEKKLPADAQKKLKDMKKKLNRFKEKLLNKFEEYVAGVALLPPEKPEQGKEVNKDQVNVLVLIDDTDSRRMTKLELKDRLNKIISKFGEEIDKNFKVQVVIYSDLWQAAYDAKYDLLQMIAMSAPIYDKGMLSAIKIAEVHKTMVIKKFEKYVVSYVLSGSLVRGQATETSDIDVFIVVDDTDVKKMTRVELKDKLRAIIIGMGIEAGEITGVRNKLNIQVYILTDFWASLREANPVIFTLLRDGVPFYDRGMFMPWKQMLKMGKIKPSPEAIEMFMNSGDQMLKRVKAKLNEIGMEDTYYAILTPSQAALMHFGIAPPAPRETAKLMREIFVKKEKLLEEKYVSILEKNIDVRKQIEHGTLKELSGKEIDKLLTDAEDYLKRITKLFEQIDKQKEKETVVQIYEDVMNISRDALSFEGVEKVTKKDIVDKFNEKLVHTGIIPEQFLRILKNIIKAKADYDSGKLTKVEIEKARKESNDIIKTLVEYIERKRGKELEQAKIRVKHGDRFGEVYLLSDKAYIVHDVEREEEISVADVTKEGNLNNFKQSDLKELEKALAQKKIPQRVFIKEEIFGNLREVFGKDCEILLSR